MGHQNVDTHSPAAQPHAPTSPTLASKLARATGTAATEHVAVAVARARAADELKRRKGTKRGPPLDLSSAPSQVWSGDDRGQHGWETWQLELGFVRRPSMVRRPSGGVVVCVKAQPSPARPKKKVAHLRDSGAWNGPASALRCRPRKAPGTAVVTHRRLPVCPYVLVWIPLRPSESSELLRYQALGSLCSGRNFENLIPEADVKTGVSGAYCGKDAGLPLPLPGSRCNAGNCKHDMHLDFTISRFQDAGERVLVDNGRVSFCGWNVP